MSKHKGGEATTLAKDKLFLKNISLSKHLSQVELFRKCQIADYTQ